MVVVKDVWTRLKSKSRLEEAHELEMPSVVGFLSREWGVADPPTVYKFITRCCYSSYPDDVSALMREQKLDLEDYHSIFCRGIFKYTLITAVQNLLISETSNEPNLMIRLIV